MKVIATLFIPVFFALAATISHAENTSLDADWICTTNASSDYASDKTVDEKMKNTPSSALEAFTFASTNCRDCTKITCELQKNGENKENGDEL